jgi:PqqD family protein of HPr-rel-A system
MAGPRYVADPPGAVASADLEGLTALFHARSGTTHILAPPAPQILQALGAGPADAGEIAARLAAGFDLAAEADAEAAISARLAELEAAGLVWRESRPSPNPGRKAATGPEQPRG